MWKTQKKQRQYYSGKKKRHTLKTQVAVDIGGQILAIKVDKGRTHDYKLFKESKFDRKVKNRELLADSGYQGIVKLCPKAKIPKKKTKKTPLTKEEKKENQKHASKRIIVEQINAKIKVFKITKYPYRNRRKRFGLRMNLICALINLDAKPTAVKIEGANEWLVLGEVYYTS